MRAEYVTTGKPKIGGAIYRAPKGTPLPENATANLNEAFKEMGYASEDGLTNTKTRENSETKAWGGDIVLNSQTSKTDEFKWKMIESLNVDALKAVHGDENVTGTLQEGLTIRENSAELEYAAWVIDMIQGDYLKRIVIPEAKVTEIGDVVYKDDEAVAYDVTVKARPYEAYEGDTHREYISGQASL